MDYPPTKMRGARDATSAAIDALRDGTSFAVIAGTHVANEIYPGNGGLAVAGPATRGQAKDALRRLSAGGGTAIGTWLRLADRLLASADVSIRHGIHRRAQRARGAGRPAGRPGRLRGPVHL
jgi:hypothetical protein